MFRRPPRPNPTPPQFRPLPLLGNPHVQTIVANLFKGSRVRHPTKGQVVDLPDGDRLMLHLSTPADWRPGDRTVLLVHGLGGSHLSGYMQRLTNRFVPQGFRVARLDLRGCGHGTALARKPYHAGCSDDVRAAVEALTGAQPESPVSLFGVSLGANIALKLAGEAADRPLPALDRVAALAPPIDMVRCSELLARPHNRIYDNNFVKVLLRQVQLRQRLIPDLPPLTLPPIRTLRQFDDLFTAPLWHFADALDYYRKTSSLPHLPRIQVPTLILTARDDPFIAPEPFEEVRAPEHVQVRIVPRGGHIGFLGWDGAGGVRWAERLLADWVAAPAPRRWEELA